jgi:hypothetical protein
MNFRDETIAVKDAPEAFKVSLAPKLQVFDNKQDKLLIGA